MAYAHQERSWNHYKIFSPEFYYYAHYQNEVGFGWPYHSISEFLIPSPAFCHIRSRLILNLSFQVYLNSLLGSLWSFLHTHRIEFPYSILHSFKESLCRSQSSANDRIPSDSICPHVCDPSSFPSRPPPLQCLFPSMASPVRLSVAALPWPILCRRVSLLSISLNEILLLPSRLF
jgi:hypothetical protein